MKKTSLFFLVLLFVSQISFAAIFIAGKDYHIIDKKIPVHKQVTVLEFFNYGCPGCNFTEPEIEAWLKNKPTYVDFKRVPLTFETGWASYAKAYYIAEALGIEKKVTPALFLKIHGQDGRQYHDMSSDKAITNFLVAHGAKRNLVVASLNSSSMDAQLQHGVDLMKQYGVMETPTFVIANKYRVSMSDAHSPKRFVAIMAYLVKKTHQEGMAVITGKAIKK